jgi:hypothetical protein
MRSEMQKTECRELTLGELHQVCGGDAALTQCVVHEAQTLANWISAGCVGPSPLSSFSSCAQQKGSGGLNPL